MNINNYVQGVHMGIQPIRVLEQNIIKILESEFPGFEELKRISDEMGLKKGIKYHSNEFSIINKDWNRETITQLPYINFDKEINIHETFLSYLWIISYSLVVTYWEYDPSINKSEEEVLNSEYIKNANKLLEYGISLLRGFSKWDYNLPNPERVDAEDIKLQEYIEKTNGMFLYAVLFILFHEISHVKLKHIEYGEEFYKKYYSSVPDKVVKKMEYEADEKAFELINRSIRDDNKLTIQIGSIIAMCSLLILSKNYRSETHPDNHERLFTALENMNLQNDHALWNIASMSIILWSVMYKTQLDFRLKYSNPKELFLSLYEQLNKFKGNM